jgi:hypothetical protein
MIFAAVFPCFLGLFFTILKFPPICKIRVHNHVKNLVSGRQSLLTLCNFVFKRPMQAPRTVNYVIS